MKCFNHPDREAVALCTHCRRALCVMCLTTASNDRIACLNRCEASVEALGGSCLPPKEKRRFLIGGILLLLLSGISFLFTYLDRHCHWTEYANSLSMLPIIFIFPIFFVAVGFLQVQLEIWQYVKRERRGKEKRQ